MRELRDFFFVALLVGGFLFWRAWQADEKEKAAKAQDDGHVVLENRADDRSPVWPSSDPSYAAIDQHALQAPAEVETSVASLAAYLTKPAKNHVEKARALYRWVTDRIAYNAEDYLAGKKDGDNSLEAVLRTRKSVCAGYARLFKALCQHAGLEAIVVNGYARGYKFAGEAIKSNHAWNAVKLDGRWYLIEATWGAGALDDKTKSFVKSFKEYYFLVPPEQLIYSHFPDNPTHQLVTPPVTAATYQQWPKVPVEFFQYGVAAETIRTMLHEQDFRGFVKTFRIPESPVRLDQVPLAKHLREGNAYHFRLEAPGAQKVAVINNGKWQHFSRLGQVYEGLVTPLRGTLKLSAQFPEKGGTFWSLCEYVVE